MTPKHVVQNYDTPKHVVQNYETPKHVVQNYMKHTNTLYRIHSVVRQVVPYIEVAIDFKVMRIRGALSSISP